ncbi:unnamed protein product [Thelazia callipaeda]|uniref:Uncharacterized protein n=1 Tax=Thelazia callipaeda TaxID=103827 RepID=A0A0N5D2L0_THECL|nr:unnamed protein product [Thelazia callipaeda]
MSANVENNTSEDKTEFTTKYAIPQIESFHEGKFVAKRILEFEKLADKTQEKKSQSSLEMTESTKSLSDITHNTQQKKKIPQKSNFIAVSSDKVEDSLSEDLLNAVGGHITNSDQPTDESESELKITQKNVKLIESSSRDELS